MHETIDPAAVVGALSPGARVISAEPLRGGVSAAVFAVSFAPPDGAPERVVVRQHRSVAGKDGTPGERAAREFAALQALHARGVAVPAPRLFIPPATMVIAFVDGTSELPPDAAGALAHTLADIHRLPRQGLPALPTFDDPMPSLHEWFPQLHAHPVLQALAQVIMDLGEDGDEPSLERVLARAEKDSTRAAATIFASRVDEETGHAAAKLAEHWEQLQRSLRQGAAGAVLAEPKMSAGGGSIAERLQAMQKRHREDGPNRRVLPGRD